MSFQGVEWLLILVAAGGLLAAVRIFNGLRNLRRGQQTTDWDAKVIERLRAQGSDPFSPHDVVFFFALPTEAACEVVSRRLRAEGFEVTSRAVGENAEFPYSVHASRSLRLSVPDMREFSRRFGELATQNGGRYDGWTAGVVSRR